MVRDPIHILGIGNVGKLIAHSLRKSRPETPVTLLFHRYGLEQEWNVAGRNIEIVSSGKSDLRNGFNHEMLSPEQSRGAIKHLVVATKTYATVAALYPLKDRLDQSSTILFTQNGIGVIDEVTSRLFQHPASRPNYLAGIVSHGLYKNDTFSSTHAGLANIIVGPALVDGNRSRTDLEPSTVYLEQELLGCPVLNMSMVSSQSLLQSQLLKLAVNATINPLSVIFDRLNGDLLRSPRIVDLMRATILELSHVMTAIAGKSRQDRYNVKNQFSAQKLESIVFEVGEINAKNSSSMRQDVHGGRRTEIDYMNGYIVAQAALYGIPCPLNQAIVRMVKQVKIIQESDIETVFGL